MALTLLLLELQNVYGIQAKNSLRGKYSKDNNECALKYLGAKVYMQTSNNFNILSL